MEEKQHVTTLARRLKDAGNPERASGQKAYLKSDLDFFGVTIPEIRKTARDFRRQHPKLSREELLVLAEELWKTSSHDLHSLAIALLQQFLPILTEADMDTVLGLLKRSHTWDHVDWLSTGVSGPLVVRYESAKKKLPRWAKDKNFWVRRASLLSLLGPLRAGAGDFALFARLAAPMIEEKEFFIRKAIGWVLREVAKKRPALTYGFLSEHITTVSGLTLREGAKYLPAPQRQELLQRYTHRA